MKNLTKEQINTQILEFGSDNLSVFGGEYEGGINLQQVPFEITECIYFLLSQNKTFQNFLEVGSAGGGNTFTFHHFFNPSNVVIVDDNNHPKHGLRPNTLKHIEIKEFIGNSQGPEAKEFIKNLNMMFDLMFIDADHSYEGVKNDTNNYLEFLNKDGFLLFHDIEVCEGVKEWHNELKNNSSLELAFEVVSPTTPKCGISIFRKK
jgi:predicted O-methyltransferase YrrM